MNKSTINATAVRKRLLPLLLVLCMLLTLLPTAALAADAPSGYTTDSHGIMAYAYTDSYKYGIDLKGYYNNGWRQVTYSNRGFSTVVQVNGSQTKVTASRNPSAVGSTGLAVSMDANLLNNGTTVQFLYTVKNTGSRSVTFGLASGGDIQIGRDDWATITPFDGGFKMSSRYESDGNAQLNFWCGSGIDGVTAVDTYWYGWYFQYASNYFNNLSPKTTLSNHDSGCAWSWKDRTIAAGATQTYSVLFGVGAPGSESEILTPQNTVSYSTTLGTVPSSMTVEENNSVTLPILTEAGYEFGGWYSDSGLTSFVGEGGTSYTPTDDITLYAKWAAIQSPVNVTVTKDSIAWTGQSLALYQSGYYKCALTEGTGGVYSADVANGTYDIYKDGVDTGENAVAATTATGGSGAAVSVAIGYTTLTAVTQLDGSASTTPGAADYRIAGAVQLTPTGSGGTYTAIVRDTNTSGYDVYVNAQNSDQDISVAANNVTVNYFTAEVTVKLDSAAYAGRSVVISRTESGNTYYYTAVYESDGKYTVMLPAGPSNNYTYTVAVDGRALSDTVSYDKKTASAAYYIAHVDVQKNGSDWTSGVCVYLENNGAEQKLTYTGGTDYQLILFADDTAYNVLVTGSNSPQDTGVDVTSSDASKTISYWTVSFYTTNDSSAYISRVIQNGKTVSKPSTPNVVGKSFVGWYTAAERTETYDYSTAIGAETSIYAKLVEPAVVINDTVIKDDGTYTVPNLTITGFPADGTPVKTAILTVNSGTVMVTSGSGYTVTGSGGTAVTVKFGDNGTSMADAQAFLRANTVATLKSTPSGGGGIDYTAQTLTMTVCGDTSEGGGTTSATKIYPVTLHLNGGTVNSGNLSYYKEGVGATLPTDLSKPSYTFAGWQDGSGNAVTKISTLDTGAKEYYAQWTSGTIDFGTPVLSGSSFTYPNLVLTSLADPLYCATITAANGRVTVENVPSGCTVYYDLNHTTATINFGSTGKSVADVQSFLQSSVSFTGNSPSAYPVVTMTLDGNTTNLAIGAGVTFVAGDGTYGTVGHYYMYVPSSEISWSAAYNAAKGYTYMGMKGYLATITSSAEDIALDKLTNEAAWSGGTRLVPTTYDMAAWATSSTDNAWHWVCGPEAGSLYYNSATYTAAATAASSYSNWNGGEPNASGGTECCMQIHASGKWNDLNEAAKDCKGYCVEFGGYTSDPGNPSAAKTVTGTTTVKTYAPTASGSTVYANGSALIVSGSSAYWDKNSNGELDGSEDNTAIYSGATAIYAGTDTGFATPLSGQITVLDGSTVGTIKGGNVPGPVCVNLSGNVNATDIDLDNITMVAVKGTLTGDTGGIKLTATNDLGAERVLAIDETGADVIDMTKFTLNSGNNAVIAVGNELQISSYGVNTGNSVTTTLTGTPPTYYTAAVEVRENGSPADADSVVLKPESGGSITLNRSDTGVYSYTGLMSGTAYTLYVNDVAVGEPYAAFAENTVNQGPSYYTAQVTYKVNANATDAQSVVLRAAGKDDITLTQQTDSDTGNLITGVYEYRALENSVTEYDVYVNGEDSGETLKFSGGDYQKTVNRCTTEVALTNSGAWGGQAVTLRDDSGIVYTLSETGTPGTYSVLTDSNYVGIYSIYVNGEDSGTDITPSATAKTTSNPIAYMTAAVTTNKDGMAASLGTVTVGGKAATETGEGIYTITLPAGSYAVTAAGTNVGTVTSDSTSLTADFYTVTYDENGASGTVPTDDTIYFGGSTVTVLSAGELSNSGNVFAGWQTGGTTYDVGETFTITGAATLTAQWSSTADAEASWTIGGTTHYGTLSEAIAAADHTGLPVSITIQNDVTITENITIPDNAVVTVPEGNTVTVAENVTLTNKGTINSNGTITGGGTLDNNGTLDNTAAAGTSGTIHIATDNAGGEIDGGIIASGGTVSGGDITGPVVNNGIVNGTDVTGDVTNNGTLTDTGVSGDVDNNSGAVISGGTITGNVTNASGASMTGGTTVNGNVDNEGTVESITVNGNLDSSTGTVNGVSVSGITTAPGGSNIDTAAELVTALGGAAHIDAETGAVVLDGDVDLDHTIAITGGNIPIDLNGHSITGPSGADSDSGTAGDGGAAITVTGGSVEIEDSSINGGGSIVGGAGGAGSTASGNGGAGIAVSGGTVTVGENAEVIGGSGGRDETGSSGSGGAGIAVSGGADVIIEGVVTGGTGGESVTGGSGGSGVETRGTGTVAVTGNVTGGSGGDGDTGGSGGTGVANKGSGTVELNGTVTGGSGGDGDTGGSGGAGVKNESTGTVELNGTVSGGSGGTNSEGVTAGRGTSLSGKISYSILKSGLTGMKLANLSATTVETENGLVTNETDIKLECSFTALYDMAASAAVGIYNSATGTTTALDSSYYTFNSTTGVITISQNAPVTGNIVITAAGVKKAGTVTITTEEEWIEALKNGFTNIVVNDNISMDEAVTVPKGTTVSVASGKTITVADGGSIANNGVITGDGDVTVANGGSISNKGTISNNKITVSSGSSVTNRNSGSIMTTQTIANNGTVTNDGTITSTIANSGTVYQVDGALEIAVTGTAAVIVFKVGYHVNGVGIAPDAALNVTALPNPLPTPTGNSYYTFNGWFTDSSRTTAAVAGTAITGNTVLYAGWTYTGGYDNHTTREVSEGTVPVIVDGAQYDIGTAKTRDGVTTVTPDQDKLTSQIKSAETGGEVVVPITTAENADSGAAVLVLQNIEDMGANNMSLTVEVDGVALTLPAGSIDTASVAETLGAESYEEVPVTISLTTLSGNALETVLKTVKSTGAEPVGSAFNFTVTAQYGGKSVDVTTFGYFTSRRLPIKKGSEITTAVVVEEDGTLRHVPTNGTTASAIVSSLTNSNYVLIYNEQTFTDVSGTWYEDTVNEMASRKIINGVGGGLFAGERSITRAEFAAIIVRALGLPADGTADFSDVHKSAWYAGAVGTAYKYGIVNGKSTDLFDPMANITRQEAMAMVARAAKIAELEGQTTVNLSAFTDAESVDAWARSYVEYNVANGLIVGKGDGKLDPLSDISRAETATVTLRLLRISGLIDVRS